jgi:MoaA/NifB/PqqE/SkfB family radical SAM enzyme
MGGAMAGSAICSSPSMSYELDTVTLTVNNTCNLDCPHCYLQYGGGPQFLSLADLERVLASQFRHLCIVGKEPLANAASADLVARMVGRVAELGRSTSIITNGLNLRLLPVEALARLAWVDISLDSSPELYSSYRGGSFSKLSRGIEFARRHGLQDLRILNAIAAQNIVQLDAMLEGSFAFCPTMVVISPFQQTRAQGRQFVAMVHPRELYRAVAASRFRDRADLRIILDAGYLNNFAGAEWLRPFEDTFGSRMTLVATDPIDRGLIRVTYDGLVLSPLESVHTDDYSRLGRRLADMPLNDWFYAVRNEKLADAGACG